MRLKTLEMSGFKSFVDRTAVSFEEGITGVVGPNGAGKSNIVDAIRWVMGEMSAKHLRGSEMADVIFNGCETRQPTGMAQVFLTFDNSEGYAPAEYSSYSEIQVGRRLYRSGESEYFINKTPCRLKDIVDLFLGTGVGTKAYSIVEQGMVGQIVSARPEERRLFLEEAAGISKFKARKEAALRKMESTRLNLTRLNDIIAELTRQINSLNRQAKKAERYQKISSELRERELVLSATRYRTLKKELDALESEHLRLKEIEVASSAALATSDVLLESKRLEMAQAEREFDGVQQDLYRAHHSVKLVEAEIAHRTKEDADIAKQIEVASSELGVLKKRLDKIEVDIEQANSAMVSADIMLADSAGLVVNLEALVEGHKSNVRRTNSDCDELRENISSDATSIATLNNAVGHLGSRHVELTGRVANNQAAIDAIDRRLQEIGDEKVCVNLNIKSLNEAKSQLSGGATVLEEKLAAERLRLVTMEEELSILRNEVSEKRARLSTLKELRKNLEGYRDGVRAVLTRTDSQGEKLSGVVGSVSELVETDPPYEAALGAALGEKLQYVVVRSHEHGIEAIDYLKTAAAGRGTFIPVGVREVGVASEMPTGDGVVGRLLDYVRTNDECDQICRYLLGDVVLVEDISRAFNLWGSRRWQNTFVTRDGCVLNPSGVISGGGGTSIEEQLVAQKRRVGELGDEFKSLSVKLSSAETDANLLRDCVKGIDMDLVVVRRDLHEKEIELVGKEASLDHLCDELSRLEGEREGLTLETAQLAEEIKAVERERTKAELTVCQHTTDRERAEGELAKLQEELGSYASELGAREANLIELKVELAKAKERQTSVEREISGLIHAKVEVSLGIGKREGDIKIAAVRGAIIGREVEGLRGDLNLAIRSIGHLQESQRVLKERYESVSTAMRDHELSVREIRNRHDDELTASHDAQLKLIELSGKVKYLVDGARERYRLDLPSVEGDYARDGIDIDVEDIAVAELKERLERLGPVNVDAIREFDELRIRHDFLTKQSEDLVASLENLSKAIARINRTSRQRFRRAFDAVDEKFQMLFPKLFQGGAARLLLTDEENLLETGVEIVAQPPGKRLQSITLLSGGEKALTAVALIFSIFLVKPSPFCLLDEVDAPLDDANIDRFNDLIRSMTPHSQFILITHNKRTMELADLLYGVTMEEAGVSKMVSVKLGAEESPVQAVA